MKIMSVDLIALSHICSVLRRDLIAEFKDFDVLFVPYKSGQAPRAFLEKQSILAEHAGNLDAVSYLNVQIDDDFKQSFFAGFCASQKKGVIPFLKKDFWMGIVFINADTFENIEDARQYLYIQIFHILMLRQDIKDQKTDFYVELYDLIKPQLSSLEKTKRNMLGDCFGAIIEALDGQLGFIKSLARKRALSALTFKPCHVPELYPYPITSEATQIVFEEFIYERIKNKSFSVAVEFAHEIGVTYDDTSLNQWIMFTRNAQDLATLGYDKNKILSTAIYTSEDPYIRSTAYLVSEILNLDPAPTGEIKDYNPFTNDDTNARLHKKICLNEFSLINERVTPDDLAKTYFDLALDQNKNLLNGHAIGWSAHAYSVLSEYTITEYEAYSQKSPHAPNFNDLIELVSIEHLMMLQKTLVLRIRKGLHNDVSILYKMLTFLREKHNAPQDLEAWDAIKFAFEKTAQLENFSNKEERALISQD